MKTCPACSAQVQDDATACPECGGPWSEEVSIQAAPQVPNVTEVPTVPVAGNLCPVCGEPLGAGVREEGWCSRCGTHLLQNRQTHLWLAVDVGTGKTPGVGIAGFVVGLISLVLSPVPIVVLPGSIVAVVLSAVGVSQASQRHASRGLAIAGLVIGLIALGIALIYVVVLGLSFAVHG